MGLFDAIGNAVSAAVDVVTDMADVAVSVATLDVGGVVDGVGNLVGDIGDTFEAVTDCLGPIGSVLEDAVGALASGGGLGGILNSGLDSLGLPDWVGDIAGGVLDFCTGNYVGTLANGLDALEDVAKACGGDEIAGFLKAGSEVTGMFSGGGLGAAGKLGKVGDVLGSVSGTVSNIEHTMNTVGSLMDGDLVGAGASILETFGPGLGEFDPLLGPISDSAAQVLEAARDPTSAILDAVGGALGDGSFGFADLGLDSVAEKVMERLDRAPGELFKNLGDIAGGPHTIDDPFGLFKSVNRAVTDFMSIAHDTSELIKAGGMTLHDNPLVDSLLGGVANALADAVGIGAEDVSRIEDTIKLSGDLFNIAAQDPDAMSILQDLLSQAPVPSEMLQTILHQGGTLRA